MQPTVTLAICWGKKRLQGPRTRAKGRRPSMGGEIERSPVLAAPSFNDYVGLTAPSTNLIVGEDDEETQAANDLCKRYLPLARKIASRYRGRGVDYEDLRSAAELGLTLGSRKFDPRKGAFGPYVTFWI